MESFNNSLFNSIICIETDPNTKTLLESLNQLDPILFYESTFKKFFDYYTLTIEKLTKVPIWKLFNFVDIFSSKIFKEYFENDKKEAITTVICKYLEVIARYYKIQKVQLITFVFQLLKTEISYSVYNFGNIVTDARAKITTNGDGLKWKKIEVRSDIDNIIHSNLLEYRDQIATSQILTYIPSNGQTEIRMDIPIMTTIINEMVTLQNEMCDQANQNFCKFVPYLMASDDTTKPEQLTFK